MSDFTLTREPDHTLKIKIVIPWTEIEKARENVINKSVSESEIKGFRKGKAPRDLVEKSLDTQKVLETALQELVPRFYNQAIKELAIKPLLLPQFQIEKGEPESDWQIVATTCEAPVVDLDGYKSKLTGHLAAQNLWTPDKGSPKDSKPESPEDIRQKKLNSIINWLLTNISLQIPPLLVEEEVNHTLTRLLDQLQKLGLTVDQYLASKGKTAESLRDSLSREASESLKMEFILEKIAEEEKIEISQAEIDKWIASADEQTAKLLGDNNGLSSLRTSLKRKHTLDFLATLA